MKQPLSHHIETKKACSTWYISGDLIIEETAALRQHFYNWLQQRELTELVIELENLTKIDASGISLFVSFQNLMNKSQRHFKIRKVPHHIFPIFEKTNLVLYFDIEKE